jgi:hypothetical protein
MRARLKRMLRRPREISEKLSHSRRKALLKTISLMLSTNWFKLSKGWRKLNTANKINSNPTKQIK